MKNKEPLKVGDRVKMHGYSSHGVDVEGVIGEITQYPNSSTGPAMVVMIAGGGIRWVQLSQCRRIVRKPRETLWLNRYPDGEIFAHPTRAAADRNIQNRSELLEVRVVKRHKP